MSKYFLVILSFFVGSAVDLKAQDSLPTYQSKKFRSLDLNLGKPILRGFSPIPVSILYQQNLRRGFSWFFFSQVAKQFGREGEYANYINWVEALGVGGSIGNKWVNTGLFLVGGGRFYYSKVTANNSALFQEPTLVTNKLMPEFSLLINLKVGKNKFYGTSQIYIPILPLKNLIENLNTFSIGVGYRFKGKG